MRIPGLTIFLALFLPFLAVAQPGSLKAFKDTAGYFSTKYPSTWTSKIKEGNRVFFTSPADSSSDAFLENINISVTVNTSYATMKVQDLVNEVKVTIPQQFSTYREESIRYFKWNNTDAAEMVGSGLGKTNSGFEIRIKQWYCFYQSRLYVITYVAKEDSHKHDKAALEIMNALIFK